MMLKGEIYTVSDLVLEQKKRMCYLLNRYFQHITYDCFENDLSEKDWVIMLSDADSGVIQGFSTQKLLRATVRNMNVRGLFSGDTIIDKDFWGGTALVKKWFELVFSLLEEERDSKLYWFLISMGYKTYRYLPIYFYNFYPCFNKNTPVHEKSVLDAFARMKYPQQYSVDRGIIHFDQDVACLKADFAKIPEHKLSDPHVKYFLEMNPLFAEGDELACLAELTEHNLKPIVRKLMGETAASGA
jgi:hypothetical protein